MYTDTVFAKPSRDGFTCAQIFANEYRFVFVVLMAKKGHVPYGLRTFLEKGGLPEVLTMRKKRVQRNGQVFYENLVSSNGKQRLIVHTRITRTIALNW